jgi:hypothetical protein
MLQCEEDGCGAAGNADLVVYMLQVMGGGLFTDDKLLSNLAVAGSCHDQAQDLDFTVRETRRPFAPVPRFRHSHPEFLRQRLKTLQ